MKEHTDRLNVNPDIYQMGIKMFTENDNFHKLFKFITLYVQRFYSDAHLQKCTKTYVNRILLELISLSDIAYVLASIKNGKGVWDQGVRMAANQRRYVYKQRRMTYRRRLRTRTRTRKLPIFRIGIRSSIILCKQIVINFLSNIAK